MTIRLTGLPALLIVIAFGAFVLWRNANAYADLGEGAAEELEIWLRAEYTRKHLRDVDSEGNLEPATVDALLATRRISFPSIEARGSYDGMVVRAEFLIDGKPPPDGNNVRYYNMEYSVWTGWTMEGETFALAYFLALF